MSTFSFKFQELNLRWEKKNQTKANQKEKELVFQIEKLITKRKLKYIFLYGNPAISEVSQP